MNASRLALQLLCGLMALPAVAAWNAIATPVEGLRRAVHTARHPAVPASLQRSSSRIVERPDKHGAGGASSAGMPAAERSVLVLGWFFASSRELDYVRRAYCKNGYKHVVVAPSVVGVVTKPRGWYRAIRRRLRPASNQTSELGTQHMASGHFDVVHCLSGGFLSLYLLRRSGVPLTFSNLLLDSTPIMPKPAAFTRFTRAYLRSIGLALPLRLLPRALHQWLVRVRWSIGLKYVQLRHRLLVALGREQGEALDSWTAGPVQWALDGEYSRVARHALGTVYQGASKGARVLFAFNPDDPYIDTRDVDEAAQVAREVGLRVETAHVTCDHIKAMFTSPRLIFRLLSGDDKNKDKLTRLETWEKLDVADVDEDADAHGLRAEVLHRLVCGH